jgi:hypothetical protein
MNEEIKDNILLKMLRSKIVVLAFGLGLLFPFVAWTVEFIRNQITVSFAGFGIIHTNNPLLFIVDLVPFVFMIGAYLIDIQRLKTDSQFRSQINERDVRMNAMADFAKQIGEGKYHSDLRISTDHDILAQSLILMRDNLLQNFKKETEQSWIADGKETISDILRQHNKIEELSVKVIQTLVSYTKLIQGCTLPVR